MPDQDKIKVKHLNGAVTVTVTPAEGAAQTLIVPSGEQARYVGRHMGRPAGDESESEAKFTPAS